MFASSESMKLQKKLKYLVQDALSSVKLVVVSLDNISAHILLHCMGVNLSPCMLLRTVVSYLLVPIFLGGIFLLSSFRVCTGIFVFSLILFRTAHRIVIPQTITPYLTAPSLLNIRSQLK